jgi:hypothetical protein
MAGEDRSGRVRDANSGENRPMKLIGFGIIAILVIAVILLATGLGEMAPWDIGGAASSNTQ